MKYKEIMENGLKGQIQTTNEANVVSAISIVGAAYDNDPTMTADEVLQSLISETQGLCPDVTVK